MSVARVVKLSISLPAELAAEMRKKAGAGRVSSFIEQAVARRLESISLGEILVDMDDEFGPVPDARLRIATERLGRRSGRQTNS